jgi:hypothetical protein
VLQRILGAVLVVVGLGGIAFGVASATVLKESDTVVATARPTGDGTVVVTDPGVLDMVAADVTVTATVPEGQQVTLVVGRDVDVLGWIGADPYSRVTGMTDWETLSTQAVTAPEDPEAEDAEAAEEPAEPQVLDPRGSDMWVSELTEADEVSLRWTAQSGPWMVMAAGTGAAPAEAEEGAAAEEDAEAEPVTPVTPTLQLTWNRDAGTPLLWPSVGIGALLLLVGLALLASSRRRRRRVTADAVASPAASPAATSAASPFSATSARSADDAAPESLFATTAAASTPGATWPPAAAPVDAPSAPEPVVADTDDRTPGQDDPAAEEGSGTAPVPVAGRFSRRSLLGRGRATDPVGDGSDGPAVEATAVPASEQAAQAPAESYPAAPAPDDATEGRPLTRRELRRREEERRAAEPSGMGRALRALTGQTPVVPAPPADAPGSPAEPQQGSRRSAAWRETWGFDPTSASRTDDTTDEGTR